MNRNNEIRDELRKSRIYLYELAKTAKISEPTIIRWLREPLTDERYAKLSMALDALKAGGSHD